MILCPTQPAQVLTLEAIVNALQVLRTACGTQSATYHAGTFTTGKQ